MPNTERFIAKLEVDGGSTNLKPLKITIMRASRRTEGTELPYLSADDTSPPGADTKVWLQIWECDSFEGARQSAGAKSTNDFLVEIPGYIKQAESGGATYEFRVLEAPTLATGDTVGWLTLKLKDSHDQPYGGEAGFIVPIVGEAEDDLDLGVTLETSAGTKTHENQKWTKASCLHLSNLTHVIGAMLAEGGLTLCFWADINDKDMRADRADWTSGGQQPPRVEKGDDGKEHKVAKGDRTGKYIADIINDAEFEVQAAAFAKRFHSLRLNAAGDLVLGCTPFFNGESQISSAVADICQKVHQDFLKGRGDPPKLKRIAMMAHGWHSGIWTKRPDHFMGRDAARSFARDIAPNCLDDLVFTLYACLCGYNKDAGDATFGSEPSSGRRLGEGSFGESLCQSLKDAGLSRAAVWAHTTAGHTTKNPNLRAFIASQGDAPVAADLVWMVQDKPDAKSARGSKIQSFLGKAANKGDDVMHLSILHPGADVQRCTGGSCTA
jgi:hypothetical protein